MNNISENDNSSDYEPISTIEAFDSILQSMNQNLLFDQIDHSIDNKEIKPEKNFYGDDDEPIKCCVCKCNMFLDRFKDFGIFIVLIFECIFYFISNILMFAVFVISYYSVLIMNYVFFISSIVSYSMAPIYKSMSGDWLNFALSFAQVILASPLIAFYIVYILKSITNLGDFMGDLKVVFQDFLIVFSIQYKHHFMGFFSMVFECKYERIFNRKTSCEICTFFLGSFVNLIIYGFVAYLTFFIDKGIIIVGFICYICNTLQIFAIVLPSYVYFVQILINKKCEKFRYVYKLRNLYKNWIKQAKFNKIGIGEVLLGETNDLDEDESNSSNSEPAEVNHQIENNDFNHSESNESVNCTQRLQKKIQKRESFIKSLFEEEEEKDEKIINDEFIDELPDDEKTLKKKFFKFFRIISDLILAEKYLSLYYFSTEIAFDRHKHVRRRIVMFIFLFFNLAIIGYDIYQLTQDYSDYLLSSIIVRLILVPLFSFYNIATVLFHKAKDKTIRSVNIASIIITFLILIIILSGIGYIKTYQKKYRIQNLEYFPPLNNMTIINEKMLLHPICDLNIFGVSAFDAFGYALSGFDIKRNNTVFDNQMKIFLGENYSSHVSYKIYELDKYFQFLIFYDSYINTSIFSFRGYNSGPEIAFQFELFASHYIIPFFEDNVPFLGTINDYWLGFYTDFLHAFGLRFFENRNLMVKYVKRIQEIYNKENYSDYKNVLFAGINTGGVLAKVVGTLLYRKSISFISFPMGTDFIEHLFHYQSTYMSYVTNVFNVDGIFSHQDADHTINIGIDTPLFHQSSFCSSGFCDVFSRWDNIYRTFCTMSETCGRGNQFNYYCLNTIGEKNLEIIRESLKNAD